MDFRNAWHRDTDEAVRCIACGDTVARSDAREYDKYGDRWNRADKSFEHLCKPCYREYCHLDRTGLEDRLEAAGAGTVSRGEFLRRYHDRAEQTRADG
jgi:DNA-directed RNA polymerase subunit N (RpoN/RPB10)